jgi:hypothetical protein
MMPRQDKLKLSQGTRRNDAKTPDNHKGRKTCIRSRKKISFIELLNEWIYISYMHKEHK